jgi:hypothetical protein
MDPLSPQLHFLSERGQLARRVHGGERARTRL